jgi:hypothetical protein
VDSNLYPTVSETISVQSELTPMGGNCCINTVLTQILACVFTTVTSTTLPTELSIPSFNLTISVSKLLLYKLPKISLQNYVIVKIKVSKINSKATIWLPACKNKCYSLLFLPSVDQVCTCLNVMATPDVLQLYCEV